MNIFSCSNCGNEYISTLDKAFVCKKCGKRDTLSKVDLTIPQDIKTLSDKELKLAHFKSHRLYELGRMLLKRKIKEDRSLEKAVEKHALIRDEMLLRGMEHKKLGQLDIAKYGTSEGAVRAWDTRGRGRQSESSNESSKETPKSETPAENKPSESPKESPKSSPFVPSEDTPYKRLESATFEGRVDHVLPEVDGMFPNEKYSEDEAFRALSDKDNTIFRTSAKEQKYSDDGVWMVRNRVLDITREATKNGPISGEELTAKVKKGLEEYKKENALDLINEANYEKAIDNKGVVKLYRVGEFGERKGEKGVFFTPSKVYAETYEGLFGEGQKVKEYSTNTANLNIYRTENLDKAYLEVIGSERPTRRFYADDQRVEELWKAERKVHTVLKQRGYDGVAYSGATLDNGFSDVTDRPAKEFVVWNKQTIAHMRGKDIREGIAKLKITKIPNLVPTLPKFVSKRFITTQELQNWSKMETVPEMSPEIKAPTQFPYKRKISRKIPKKLKVSK